MNVFIAGLTPPPNMPNMITISHVLEPIVDGVSKYGTAQGFQVPTDAHPNGVAVHVKIAPLIADLEGSCKVSGFLAHGATCFCSFCLCTSAKLEDLNLQTWTLRNGADVRNQANIWLNTTTKSGRNIQAKKTGVRWTPLHRLEYWDPVKHVVLGFMHNWLEGILKHHLRILWGIGPDKGDDRDVEDNDQVSDTDVSESASELDDLYQESIEAMSAMHSTPSMSPSVSQESSSILSATPTLENFQPNPYAFDDEESDEDLDDPDYIAAARTSFNFSKSELVAIRHCISNISLPTWVQRPPVNLGEASHGNLKAHEYLTLFSVIFPLIIPEFWYLPEPTNLQQHLISFHHLVSATNIVSSFKTSNSKADVYTYHYIQYRTSLQTLFPHNHSKPNHHYAMHNAAILKYWGPLPSLSEFPGERMNGILQKIKTNRRLSKSPITI
ncbi:hypothetical protein BDZ94DRAFT_1375542 [Collybia nuda]|uniref:Uncharacterized protein n=1 Tax=Collybia nuda TaxID=64659 RepID=A0A9P5XPC5_9AGAR|nr:hypothetical protein BDZ94DRAFT_1375542 [Collybia nuda]